MPFENLFKTQPKKKPAETFNLKGVFLLNRDYETLTNPLRIMFSLQALHEQNAHTNTPNTQSYEGEKNGDSAWKLEIAAIASEKEEPLTAVRIRSGSWNQINGFVWTGELQYLNLVGSKYRNGFGWDES